MLEKIQQTKKCTLLGVGPMSRNCVDAALELSAESVAPLMLIASRRQIDAASFGGGYVNSWHTAAFADYVRARTPASKVLLARDHGGPWQNPVEIRERCDAARALASAQESFLEDIRAGFDLLHIDTSLALDDVAPRAEAIDRFFHLLEFCHRETLKKGRKLLYEMGTESQSGLTADHHELNRDLEEILSRCDRENLPRPTFVVVQTGTKVAERRNVGTFDSPIRVAGELPAEIQVPLVLEVCRRHRILLKEHNADYLSDEALQWHPRLGIHAANVAPEFGVVESEALLELLESQGLADLADKFTAMAVDSGMWEKWLLPKSRANERDKTLLAGHYVMGRPEFQELKRHASQKLGSRGIDLDVVLREKIKQAIRRYMVHFRLVEEA